MIRHILAARLKEARERSGLTIYEVGKQIGKSGKTVSAWECGRGQPDADMLLALCKTYNISSISSLYGEQAPAHDLSFEEEQLLENYRSLNPDGREKLIEYSTDLVASRRYLPASTVSAG